MCSFAGYPEIWDFWNILPSGVRGMAVCGQGPHLLGKAAYCLWEWDKEKGGSQELTLPRSSPPGAKIQDSESSQL